MTIVAHNLRARLASLTGPFLPALLVLKSAGGRRNAGLRLIPPLAVGLCVAVAYTYFSAMQWRNHAVLSWDLSIFTQLAKSYSVLSAPIVTVKGVDFNLLGDHFHPLLVVLGPIYRLFPHAFTLLVVQNLLFGLAAAILTRSAIRIVGLTAGVLIGIVFGFSWGLQSAVEVQFHEIAFAVPLLAATFASYLKHSWRWAIIWASPLVFVKEDLGLTVLVIGVIISLRSRSSGGFLLAIWGVLWTLIAVLVVLPLMNTGGVYAYGLRADSTASGDLLASLFAPEKGLTILMLLIVTGGIALRSPLSLILLPTLAWRFISDNPGYWGPTWHYSAVLMPIAFAATLDGIRLSRVTRHRWFSSYGRQVATVVITASIAIGTTLPLSRLAQPAAGYSTTRNSAAEEALAQIPSGATVESDIGLLSYLVDRTRLYWSGNSNPAADYLVIDRHSGGEPAEWGDVLGVAGHLHPGTAYRLVYSREGYEVAARIQ